MTLLALLLALVAAIAVSGGFYVASLAMEPGASATTHSDSRQS